MNEIIPYIIAMILTIIFAYFWQLQLKIKTVTGVVKGYGLMLVTFLPLFLLNAGMYYVGTDYKEYYKYFNQLSEESTWHMDAAFETICKLVKYNGFDFQWIYVITSLIGYVLLALCMKKYTKDIAQSYFWYFMFTFMHVLGFNTIRQFIALLLVWYAATFIQERALIRYCIFVGIAACFHVTAIVMLPFYFVLDKKLKATFWCITAGIAALFNIFYSDILTWLFKTFKPSYLNSNFISKLIELDVPYILCHLVTLFIIILYFKYIWEMHEEQTMNLIFTNAVLFGIIINLFCMWLPIYKRFAIYFLVPSIWLLPNILSCEKRRKVKWGLIILQALSCAFYLTRYLPYWEVLPYQSILSK